MDNMTVIESTSEYSIFTSTYEDTIQKFRKWHKTQLIEVAFTNDFARANGYDSIPDMLREEPEMRYRLNILGGIPEWIVLSKGEFYFKTAPKMCLN